jgi:hypothetical protein
MRAIAAALLLTAVGTSDRTALRTSVGTSSYTEARMALGTPAISEPFASSCPRGAHPVDLRFVWIPPTARRARTLFDGPQRLLGVITCSNGTEVVTLP